VLFFFSIYAPRSILFFAASEKKVLPLVVLRKMDSSRYACPCPFGFHVVDDLIIYVDSFLPFSLAPSLTHWLTITHYQSCVLDMHRPKCDHCDGTNRTSKSGHITFAQSSQLDENNRFQAGHWDPRCVIK
jgi:hypothetical protein